MDHQGGVGDDEGNGAADGFRAHVPVEGLTADADPADPDGGLTAPGLQHETLEIGLRDWLTGVSLVYL